ncbi:DUF2922 domain-containing protein [Limosilactobacillus fermentum]|uniref:DUF2922 domain-containing protein n=1 Tax=Limosilactobacillus fermentum TaxID=1613 RepID=UPI00097F251F|nr:DUF2922 domain-containing protein [Limosilactobacillus fermentum]MBS6066608.1 DUF2922 domain-containing protein [Limosilactobacillus fermentum]MDU3491112.1 DUF2922 domain-containing protein [Limosilactobacillus fermentum]TFZ15766.1 DUF2922 domain-containing protein [Limosilactobacillus fermentum]SJM44311.1 conserved hypothetical protein [Limosilactobacillus fermentum]SJM55975.1 conserved hypothetical protein [Limosilactobacillus fermentum]
MKTLNLTYKGSLNKTHILKINYANGQLDEATVRQAMTQIANLKLFKKGEEELFVTPVSAKVVNTDEEVLFA